MGRGRRPQRGPSWHVLFCRGGQTIVSGLAWGIDSAAHEAPMATGTVAVLAGGPDILSTRLRTRCYMGELSSPDAMPCGFQPSGRDVSRRNRLISGNSLAMFVVAAARRSCRSHEIYVEDRPNSSHRAWRHPGGTVTNAWTCWLISRSGHAFRNTACCSRGGHRTG